jgi:5,10-methenyltetrahydrofolate synthetase
MRWRKAERQRLIGERLALSGEARQSLSQRIAANLETALGDVRGQTVGLYWPVRGEPDLRDLMGRITAKGGRCALPAAVTECGVLRFRSWAPGEPTECGAWKIPVPAGGEEVTPDVLAVPVVGFDRAGHRLGYGGGSFDRTLAAMRPNPRTIGVGYAAAEVPTIYPQSYDMPMDAIVTEAEIIVPQAGRRQG